MGACAILLPMNKAKFHSQVGELDQNRLSEAVQFALVDGRIVDGPYTVFYTITKTGATFKRLVIQCGGGTALRSV